MSALYTPPHVQYTHDIMKHVGLERGQLSDVEVYSNPSFVCVVAALHGCGGDGNVVSTE
jgi:hypothetical protein